MSLLGGVELAMLATGHGLGLRRAGQTSEANVSSGTSTYRSSAQRISGAKCRPLFHLLPCEGPPPGVRLEQGQVQDSVQVSDSRGLLQPDPSMLQR